MSGLAMLIAALAALAFYLSSRHQSLWPAARRHARWLRLGATVACIAALWLASAAYGPWCGLFVALTALMLALVALPYLDAWRGGRREGRQHVG